MPSDQSGLAAPDRVIRGLQRCFAVAITGVAAVVVCGALGCGLPAAVPAGAGGAAAARPLEALATVTGKALRISRPVLVGSRDLSLGSCVEFIRSGQLTDAVPRSKGDLDGGPGTKLAVLLSFDRQAVKSADADLRWHQTRLAGWLRNQAELNAVAAPAAARCAATSAALADRLDRAASLPADLGAAAAVDETTWPGFCLARLDAAVRTGDLPAARRWARELAGAAAWLEDLHRWLGFLADNFRGAVEFQALCPEGFAAFDRSGTAYEPLVAPSNLPAGMLTLHGLENFMELERQAEEIFAVPARRRTELESDRHLSPTSIAVPPERRSAFAALEAALGPENRATLRAAALAPYERSFLANVLFRAQTAGTVEANAEVLRRADALHPRATVAELMGTLVYRGHSFASIEWADRFQERLLDEAAAIGTGSAEQAWLAACRRARVIFDDRESYGATLSLRDALDRRVIDCVRATDLALTLYRNAGRSGAGHVRWTAGSTGHAVAALFAGTGGRGTLVADPLGREVAAAPWPAAYFRGCTWPEFLAANPQPWTAELYVRGLDSYVWAEGYVVRGAAAGRFVRARIPYLPEFPAAGTEQAFDGPHPAE